MDEGEGRRGKPRVAALDGIFGGACVYQKIPTGCSSRRVASAEAWARARAEEGSQGSRRWMEYLGAPVCTRRSRRGARTARAPRRDLLIPTGALKYSIQRRDPWLPSSALALVHASLRLQIHTGAPKYSIQRRDPWLPSSALALVHASVDATFRLQIVYRSPSPTCR